MTARKKQAKKVCFMVAGEASADLLGARLIEHLRDHCAIEGVGGALMRRAGMNKCLFHGEELAVMGFFQLLPHLRHLLQRIDQLARVIVQTQPAIVVTIDAPSFNMRLARAIRRQKGGKRIRLVHYVAPTVWAWKRYRARAMARLYDDLLTLLPFENDYFTPHGLACHYVGHPAAWREAVSDQERRAARRVFSIKDNERMILLCPGSRRQEIKNNGKKMLEALAHLRRDKHLALKPVVMLAPRMEKLCAIFAHADVPMVSHDERARLFAASDMALAVSGTVSVELAAATIPHVIVYGGDRVSEWIVRRMVKVPYASLVNIMANDAIIPEFLFSNCRSKPIAAACSSLLHDEKARAHQCRAMQTQISRMVARDDIHPTAAAAKVILSLL